MTSITSFDRCPRLAPQYQSGFAALLLLSHVAALEGATITGFSPAVWPRTDSSLGLDRFVIEDFEDTTLAPGLKVMVLSPLLGGYGPVATLPFTYDPSQDCCGAFNASLMWDGTNGLVNRPFLPIASYANDGGWSDVYFLFEAGVSSVGFSYGQAEANISISLDFGAGFTNFANSSSALPAGGGRNGYLRIDAGPGETIYGVKLDNQAGNHDGILFDHVAFRPPVPLVITNFGVDANVFGFNVTGPDNQSVVIEASTSLSSANWIPLSTNTLVGGTTFFGDPGWTGFNTRFYRARAR